MEKRLRFGDLVREAGRPHTVALWTDPKKDRGFSEAVRQNRVLTVVQKPTGNQKDYGAIGFHQEPHASYFVFPRPLPEQTKARVIGINYQLLDQPDAPAPARPIVPKARKPPAKPRPVERLFHLTVRRTATLETQLSVRAANRKAAEQQALDSLKNQPFEVDLAEVHQEIRS